MTTATVTAAEINAGTLDEKQIAHLAGLPQESMMDVLGVDVSSFDALRELPEGLKPPITSRTNRSVVLPVLKGMAKSRIGWVPEPIMLTHILTTRCNYSCGFCSFADSLNNRTNDMALDEIELTYSSMGHSLNTIVYSGGETTLHPDIIGIIEAAYRSTPVQSIYIISNAWKPERLLEITHTIMQRCPDLHLTWSLSIEGFKDHNNATRHTKAKDWDAWKNTIETMVAMHKMRETFGYTQLDVQLCTVCTPDNHESLYTWYPFIRDVLKPDKWNLNLMRKSVQMSDSDFTGFSQRREARALSPFEQTYVSITKQVAEDVQLGKLAFSYHTDSPIEGAMKAAVDLISQEENRATLFEAPKKFSCKAGITGAYISSTGDVGGCEEFVHNPKSPKRYGNLRDNNYNFLDIWKSKQAKRFRQLTDCSTECVGCTLESQRNYPAILVSPNTLYSAWKMGNRILEANEQHQSSTEKGTST
jgi:MoaA/NifB/PqqE/SkfB family radical SAM enzyme